MIDNIALSIGHGLLALAFFRLVWREGLDADPLLESFKRKERERLQARSQAGRQARRAAQRRAQSPDGARPDSRSDSDNVSGHVSGHDPTPSDRLR
ncbi:MAG: hypothetical protein AAGH57_15215 [Pseudomonadota bacterium]